MIAAGSRSGTTQLTVTPSADQDNAYETVTLDSTADRVCGDRSERDDRAAQAGQRRRWWRAWTRRPWPRTRGSVNVRLTLENPPEAGNYTGCRLRLGTGGAAETPADVTFSNTKKLNSNNGWTARAKFLTAVDDTLVEGDETPAVVN